MDRRGKLRAVRCREVAPLHAAGGQARRGHRVPGSGRQRPDFARLQHIGFGSGNADGGRRLPSGGRLRRGLANAGICGRFARFAAYGGAECMQRVGERRHFGAEGGVSDRRGEIRRAVCVGDSDRRLALARCMARRAATGAGAFVGLPRGDSGRRLTAGIRPLPQQRAVQHAQRRAVRKRLADKLLRGRRRDDSAVFRIHKRRFVPFQVYDRGTERPVRGAKGRFQTRMGASKPQLPARRRLEHRHRLHMGRSMADSYLYIEHQGHIGTRGGKVEDLTGAGRAEKH